MGGELRREWVSTPLEIGETGPQGIMEVVVEF